MGAEWIYLFLAGLFEISFTTALKLSNGFRNLNYTLLFLCFSAASFWCLTKAIEVLPLGIAYAIWTGIGAAGTVLVGIYFFGETLSLRSAFFLCLLIGSIVGLKSS